MGWATQAEKAARPSSVMEKVFLRRLPWVVSAAVMRPSRSSLARAVCTLPALWEQMRARFCLMNCCSSYPVMGERISRPSTRYSIDASKYIE